MRTVDILKEKYTLRLDFSVFRLSKSIDLVDALLELYVRQVYSQEADTILNRIEILKDYKKVLVEKYNAAIFNRCAKTAELACSEFISFAENNLSYELGYIGKFSKTDPIAAIREQF